MSRLLSLLFLLSASTLIAATPELKVGLIGLDNSHVISFSKATNGKSPVPGLEGVRIVAAFPGGSPDLPNSADRLEGFTKSVRENGVEIVSSIEQLLPLVDAVIITSVDGRVHLEQAKQVIAARKPLFIDKPLATSYADGAEILKLAQQAGVPCFSTSSLRFHPDLVAQLQDPQLGQVLRCVTFSPATDLGGHPPLFFYGIHGVETIFAIMGPGCESVSCTHTNDTDVAVGVWKDGRTATLIGTRTGKARLGAVIFGEKEVRLAELGGAYVPLLVEIVKCFRTGEVPVAAGESLEVLAFLEAAGASLKQGGAPVSLASIQK